MPQATPVPHRSLAPVLWLAAILASGLILRIGVVTVRFSELNTERDAYLGIAQGVWDGRGFSSPGSTHPTAYRPPLYPLLLAPISAASQAGWRGAFQIALGTLTILLTWQGARRLLSSTSGPLIAAGLVALDPLLLLYTPQIMTETLATSLAAAALATVGDAAEPWSRRRQLLAGISLGLACLCRPTFLVWTALLAMWIVARGLTRSARPWRGRIAALPWTLAIATAVTIAPWPIRNQLRFGVPILTTTHGGYTLLLSNNAVYYDEVVRTGTSGVWSGPSLDQWQQRLTAEMASRGMTGELAQDRWLKGLAQEWIRSHPAEFLQASLQRLTAFWRLGPARETGESPSSNRLLLERGVAVFYGVEWLLVLIGVGFAARGKQLGFVPGLLLILSFSAMHTVYFSNARMRAPLMPALAMLAASGLTSIGVARTSRLPASPE